MELTFRMILRMDISATAKIVFMCLAEEMCQSVRESNNTTNQWKGKKTMTVKEICARTCMGREKVLDGLKELESEECMSIVTSNDLKETIHVELFFRSDTIFMYYM